MFMLLFGLRWAALFWPGYTRRGRTCERVRHDRKPSERFPRANLRITSGLPTTRPEPSQVFQYCLFHRGFDFLRRIGNSRGKQLGAILGNEVHVFQEKSLATNCGDRLKV